MARKTKKRSKSRIAANATQTPLKTRRQMLGRLAAYAGSAMFLIGSGGVLAMDYRKSLTEHDLSVIGQGVPVIVQIHDPQCSMCTALQKQTRRALKSFEPDQVLYRIANIRTEAGAGFQNAARLPHVTLVLYDAAGEQTHVIEGVTQAADLVRAFRAHLGVPAI